MFTETGVSSAANVPAITWGGGENGGFPVTLAGKLLQARKASSGYIKKDGRNEAQKYNFVSERRFITEVRELLNEFGIMSLTSVVGTDVQTVAKGDKINFLTTITLIYTFIDSDNVAWVTVCTVGQGYDSSDKASNKALTGANKYGLRQAFMIATGDDPEEARADEYDNNRAAGNAPVAVAPEWGKPEYIAELKLVQGKLGAAGIEFKALPDDKRLEGFTVEQLDTALLAREDALKAKAA